MDIISSLPDEIICHILSFLSTKEAALTSPLAKRWRNLFALSPILSFDGEVYKGAYAYGKRKTELANSFTAFVDRVLNVSSDCLIKQFTLKHLESAPNSPHIKRWMRYVLSRGRLDLQLNISGIDRYSFPEDIFSCKTLVKLKLKYDDLTVPKNASLPALKSLILDRVTFYCYHQGSALETLISGCPVLEELVMLDVSYVDLYPLKCTVSCPTLQRLMIICTQQHLSRPESIIFDTPSLVYLEYCNHIQPEYQVVNFDSLVEAKLCLIPSKNSNPTNLLQSLRNVEILDLSFHQTSEIFYDFHEVIPVFKKLYHLSTTTESNKYWKTLLKNSPNLETLVIKGPLHYYDEIREFFIEGLPGYASLRSCHVKFLEINLYGKSSLELDHLKHFLEKLTCLELVTVRFCAMNQKKQTQLTSYILNLPGSSKCKTKTKTKFEFISPR